MKCRGLVEREPRFESFVTVSVKSRQEPFATGLGRVKARLRAALQVSQYQVSKQVTRVERCICLTEQVKVEDVQAMAVYEELAVMQVAVARSNLRLG